MAVCKSEQVDSLQTEPEGKICRICLCKGETADSLIAPCGCKGSIKYLHLSCFKEYFCKKVEEADVHPVCCELCGYAFRTKMISKQGFSFRKLAAQSRSFLAIGIILAAANTLLMIGLGWLLLRIDSSAPKDWNNRHYVSLSEVLGYFYMFALGGFWVYSMAMLLRECYYKGLFITRVNLKVISMSQTVTIELSEERRTWIDDDSYVKRCKCLFASFKSQMCEEDSADSMWLSGENVILEIVDESETKQ